MPESGYNRKIVEFASLFLGIQVLTGKECKYIQAVSQSISGNRSTFNSLCVIKRYDSYLMNASPVGIFLLQYYTSDNKPFI